MREVDNVLLEEIVQSIRMLRNEIRDMSRDNGQQDTKIAVLESKLGELEAKVETLMQNDTTIMTKQASWSGGRRVLLWVIGTMLTTAGVVVGVLKLFF